MLYVHTAHIHYTKLYVICTRGTYSLYQMICYMYVQHILIIPNYMLYVHTAHIHYTKLYVICTRGTYSLYQMICYMYVQHILIIPNYMLYVHTAHIHYTKLYTVCTYSTYSNQKRMCAYSSVIIKVKFTLQQAIKAKRGSSGIALLFL